MIDFEEFSATAISVYQMEGLETWEEHAQQAYELFDKVAQFFLYFSFCASASIVERIYKVCGLGF